MGSYPFIGLTNLATSVKATPTSMAKHMVSARSSTQMATTMTENLTVAYPTASARLSTRKATATTVNGTMDSNKEQASTTKVMVQSSKANGTMISSWNTRCSAMLLTSKVTKRNLLNCPRSSVSVNTLETGEMEHPTVTANFASKMVNPSRASSSTGGAMARAQLS